MYYGVPNHLVAASRQLSINDITEQLLGRSPLFALLLNDAGNAISVQREVANFFADDGNSSRIDRAFGDYLTLCVFLADEALADHGSGEQLAPYSTDSGLLGLRLLSNTHAIDKMREMVERLQLRQTDLPCLYFLPPSEAQAPFVVTLKRGMVESQFMELAGVIEDVFDDHLHLNGQRTTIRVLERMTPTDLESLYQAMTAQFRLRLFKVSTVTRGKQLANNLMFWQMIAALFTSSAGGG